ncbi:MAG: BMP family lipoprotein, partial [Planctomycetota bacterium]
MRKVAALFVLVVVALSVLRAGREEAARREVKARVAVVLSVGGLGDRSFNDLAHRGLLMAIEESGVVGVWGEPADHAEDEDYLDLYAREGYDLVVALGYLMRSKLEKVAPRHPDTWFVLVDEALDLPNVRSYVFREEEGCFLVGALAAMKSGTGVIGFVGGLDIPLLRRFLAGYTQGARHVRPGIRVLDSWAGSFSDPVRGREKALVQHGRGADVVFQAAGATGNGVIRAAAERGFYAIGVDANQNDMAPGHVLTSMRKKVEE